MIHYIVDYYPDGSTVAPAIPKGIDFLQLASPGIDAPWALLSVSTRLAPSPQIHPVNSDLDDAISSAYRYPPALALAREHIRDQFVGAIPPKEAFCTRLSELIRAQMGLQRQASYLFAQAVRDEPGYLISGQYYWVIRYLRGSEAVVWVSSDYFLYQNPLVDFNLSVDDLACLLLPTPSSSV